ncbi:MAG: hypothetical protein H7838_10435 [Magnetococcus sp. DMHC-8]
MDTTATFSTLVRLTAGQRVAEAQAVWEALVRDDPEVAAQWYIVARLVLQTGGDQRQAIEAGLAGLGEAPQRLFRQSVHSLERVQRLERLLAQVRRARSGLPVVPERDGVRARLWRFLQQVRAHRRARPVQPARDAVRDHERARLLDRLEQWRVNATGRGEETCPFPP